MAAQQASPNSYPTSGHGRTDTAIPIRIPDTEISLIRGLHDTVYRSADYETGLKAWRRLRYTGQAYEREKDAGVGCPGGLLECKEDQERVGWAKLSMCVDDLEELSDPSLEFCVVN